MRAAGSGIEPARPQRSLIDDENHSSAESKKQGERTNGRRRRTAKISGVEQIVIRMHINPEYIRLAHLYIESVLLQPCIVPPQQLPMQSRASVLGLVIQIV